MANSPGIPSGEFAASDRVPRIALYVGLPRGVLGERLISPAGQLAGLWDQLTGASELVLDDEGRVRLDTRELSDDVQAQTGERRRQATTDTITDLADLYWFTGEVRRLYGFDVTGVDYDRPAETAIPWPDSTP